MPVERGLVGGIMHGSSGRVFPRLRVYPLLGRRPRYYLSDLLYVGRGQSLIVWAIAEGRSCAAGVDAWLMVETQLPAPIPPTARPLT